MNSPLAHLTNSGPQLTVDEIVAFEQEIGGGLPDDYKRFLLESNGGFPESPIGFRWNGEINSIFCFEMLLPDDDEVGLGSGLTHLRELGVGGFLPIASIDANGRDVCLSFQQEVDEVALAVYQCDDEAPGRPTMVSLGRSFTDFVESLFAIPSVYCPIAELGQHGTPTDLAAHLSRGHSINDLGTNNVGLIFEAIRFQNVPMINACIDHGANLSRTLHELVTRRCPEILTLLVDAGADVNEKDEYGHRPLYYVGGTGLGGEEGAANREVEKLLISWGALK